jgi:DNA excision repair protein ERCC-4
MDSMAVGDRRCQKTRDLAGLMSAYRMPAVLPQPDTGVPADATLPGLRGLRDLADLRPTIVVDQREQAPLIFTRLASVPGTLYAGDYSIAGLESSFAVERKSIDDLANCCMGANRDRFEHELLRLRGYRFKRLLVVGSREDIAAGHYHSKIAPKAVLATLGAFEVRYELSVVFAETPEAAAREIERWSWWFAREVVENANDLLRGSKAASA